MESTGGSTFDEAAAGALDRGGMHMQGVGDRRVGLVLVSSEQDAGAGERASWSDTFIEQAQEFSALLTSEVEMAALGHGRPSLRAAQSTAIQPIPQHSCCPVLIGLCKRLPAARWN